MAPNPGEAGEPDLLGELARPRAIWGLSEVNCGQKAKGLTCENTLIHENALATAHTRWVRAGTERSTRFADIDKNTISMVALGRAMPSNTWLAIT